MKIWLTSRDWTPLAEIQVTAQQRKDGKTSGTFLVEHIYEGDEQQVLGDIFRRMFGWE